MAIIHKNIFIRGCVQGVFYRASARQAALDLGIKGFVRNNADGSVYAEAEGTEEAVQEFINWCKTGPPAAEVSSIETEEGVLRSFRSFQISGK